MKKILAAVALVAIMATPAFAQVSGTAHDLSGNGTTQMCVFCHTPHGGNSAAPLWNRTGTTTMTGNYTGGGFSSLDSSPNVNAALDAVLCMSCHDGASLSGATIANQPNDADIALGTYTWTSNAANLTNDMSDDHPIGMDYTQAMVNADGELVDPTGTTNVGAAPLFTGIVWCSSCHDVHDDSNGQFLVVNNAGSALCLECHVK